MGDYQLRTPAVVAVLGGIGLLLIHTFWYELGVAHLIGGPSMPPAPLTLVTADSARCLDGSQGGYYWQKAEKAERRWVIWLQGGGECTTQETCQPKLATSLGSSQHFPATLQPYQVCHAPAGV